MDISPMTIAGTGAGVLVGSGFNSRGTSNELTAKQMRVKKAYNDEEHESKYMYNEAETILKRRLNSGKGACDKIVSFSILFSC